MSPKKGPGMDQRDGPLTQSCLHVENLIDGENNCFISYQSELASFQRILINYGAIAQICDV